MIIIINLTNNEARHLKEHTFTDECNTACKVLYKVQDEIKRITNAKRKR